MWVEEMEDYIRGFFPRMDREFKIRGWECETQIAGPFSRIYLVQFPDHKGETHELRITLKFQMPPDSPPNEGDTAKKFGARGYVSWKDMHYRVHTLRESMSAIRGLTIPRTLETFIRKVRVFEAGEAQKLLLQKAEEAQRERELAVPRRKARNERARRWRKEARRRANLQRERETRQAFKEALPRRCSVRVSADGFGIFFRHKRGRGIWMSPEDARSLGEVISYWFEKHPDAGKGAPIPEYEDQDSLPGE